MADSFEVKVTNAAAFDAAIGEIRAGLHEPKDPLDAAARELVTVAAAAAPRASGRLAGSHRALPASGNRVRVVADTPYAAVQHWGWPAHSIRRKPWLVATWLRDRRPLDKAAESVQAGIDKAAGRI
jgi:phage-related minor tail protein